MKEKRETFSIIVNYSNASWKFTIYDALSWILHPFLIIWSRLLKKEIKFGKSIVELDVDEGQNENN